MGRTRGVGGFQENRVTEKTLTSDGLYTVSIRHCRNDLKCMTFQVSKFHIVRHLQSHKCLNT